MTRLLLAGVLLLAGCSVPGLIPGICRNMLEGEWHAGRCDGWILRLRVPL